MKKKFVFLLAFLNNYKKKLFKIIIYETYYSIKYFESGAYMRLQDNDSRTDTIPCSFYFLHKISKFINKKKIKNVADLGSGFGRVTNFLNDKTSAYISGYELDKEVFDISIKKKNKNVIIKNEDILDVNYNTLNIQCFILNDPLKKEKDLEKLLEKIGLSKINSEQNFYIIAINIQSNLIAKKFKLIKSINAGSARFLKIYTNKKY